MCRLGLTPSANDAEALRQRLVNDGVSGCCDEPHELDDGDAMTTPTMKEQSPQAVFCVAAGDEVMFARRPRPCSSVPGFVFAGGFGDYITAEKRPQFPQSMKNASACVALIDFDRDPELALKTAERLGQIFLKRISLIAVGTDLPSPLLVRAIRAGCVEYLGTPLNLALTWRLR